MTYKSSVIQKSVPKFRLELCSIYEVIMLFERAFVGAYVRETQISLILNFSCDLPNFLCYFYPILNTRLAPK